MWLLLSDVRNSVNTLTVFDGALITLAMLIIVASKSVATHLSLFLWPRHLSLPEDYPLHNTVKLMARKESILEFLLESFATIYNKTQRESFIVNVFGLAPFVFTNNVENITYVLKTNYENFTKSGPMFKSKFQGLLGDGIFNADGRQWYAHRKTSAHLFKLTEFKTTVLETFNHDLDEVIGCITNHAARQNAFDMQALMHSFTLESISQIAFGLQLGCITNEVEFARDFDFCTECINDSMLNPLWLIDRFLSPRGWRYFYCLQRLNTFAFKIIRERRELIHSSAACDTGDNDHSAGRSDLLSLYLMSDVLRDDHDKSASLQPSDQNLRDVILNMVIAGRDTTAQALSWAFYCLCIHSDVQAKVREEVVSVVGQHGRVPSATTAMSYEMLQQLRYTEAVCLEVLRLHPSVPKEGKCVMKDDVLPDGTAVYKGDLLVFSPWVMGRQTALWGPDALQFRPERFAESYKPNPFVFTAFQAGPRTCLGQNFAILEMKCALARLLAVFEFKLQQSAESVTYSNTLTLPIRGGLCVSATPLSPALLPDSA